MNFIYGLLFVNFKFNEMIMVWLWDFVAYVWKEKCKKFISKLNDIDMNGLMSCAKICSLTCIGFGAQQ